MRLSSILSTTAAAATLLFAAPKAEAAIQWSLVEANGAPNISSQFILTVSEIVAGTVQFEFKNNVGAASSITEIYFDDKQAPVLALPMTITSSSGVSFRQCDPGTANCASPGNMSGGNPIGFSADYGTGSTAPVSGNGINAATEYVRISFAYNSGGSLNEVLKQLGNGELLIGLHVQALSGGQSQSYVTSGGGSSVPEPATLLLFGAALAGLGLAARRRQQAG